MATKKMNYRKKVGSKKRSTRRRSTKRVGSNKVQKGGDPWAATMPMEYYGGQNKHYFAEGSPELAPAGHSVSQGVISADGKSAGPNLFPTMPTLPAMIGGGSKRKVSKSHKKGKKLAPGPTARRNNKKAQKGGACGCGGATPMMAGNYMPGSL